LATLYIVRHAWAGERDERRWPDDALRPLTDEGQKRFRRVAKALVKAGVAPVVIATSPLVRCRQTAEILNRALPAPVEIVDRAELAPGSDLKKVVDWSAAHPGDLAWVGHAPDVGRLVAALIGDDRAEIDFSKGAAAAIEFQGPLAAGRGVLGWMVTAKVLGL
jgi:phosphohistidine phosphatase